MVRYQIQLIANATGRHTSKAGFHHRSTRMTLLQHVRFKPVLPALNEIRITRVERLDLIFCNTASRSSLFMDPSSRKHHLRQLRRDGDQNLRLTADVTNSSMFEERFNQVQHTRELREDDRLLFRVRSFVDIFKKFQDFPRLG